MLFTEGTKKKRRISPHDSFAKIYKYPFAGKPAYTQQEIPQYFLQGIDIFRERPLFFKLKNSPRNKIIIPQ